ncbi:hypothetical protein C3F34_10445 [Acinetobacter sp. ACNIH2]|uniref:NfeD family protein n=1 Tax=Acinetobacter sp. ACNIH2 TaxID=1758189 RepID=UPI000CDC89BE|nr:hypothetical protein [Acinetobacter sp. ACNIH2]AUX86426.1 hypothetical protein C3F34_10445 [Acinetobacter sp. ACNIH2]
MVGISSLIIFDSIKKIINIVDSINNDINELEEDEKMKIISSLDYEVFNRFKDVELPEIYKFISENQELFKNNLYAKYINQRFLKLAATLSLYKDVPKNYSVLNSVVNHLAEIRRLLNDLNSSKIALDNTNIILDNELRPKLEEVEKQVKDIERAKLALQNDRIHLIFEGYEEKLKNEADSWERRFFWTLGIGAFTVSLLTFCPDLKIGFWNYIFLKVLIFSIVLTLSTYFLRRSVHLRKQSDELGRMSFEMDALPSFMSSLSNAKSEEVIIELIPKYFARSIDQTQNDKIGDLMKDQLTAGTELIKASAEMVKGVKTSFGTSDSTEQSQPKNQ